MGEGEDKKYRYENKASPTQDIKTKTNNKRM
jgi:hypothetical protein